MWPSAHLRHAAAPHALPSLGLVAPTGPAGVFRLAPPVVIVRFQDYRAGSVRFSMQRGGCSSSPPLTLPRALRQVAARLAPGSAAPECLRTWPLAQPPRVNSPRRSQMFAPWRLRCRLPCARQMARCFACFGACTLHLSSRCRVDRTPSPAPSPARVGALRRETRRTGQSLDSWGSQVGGAHRRCSPQHCQLEPLQSRVSSAHLAESGRTRFAPQNTCTDDACDTVWFLGM